MVYVTVYMVYVTVYSVCHYAYIGICHSEGHSVILYVGMSYSVIVYVTVWVTVLYCMS